MEILAAILAPLYIYIFLIKGTFGFYKLRDRWSGIISVGGSWIISVALFSIIRLIVSIVWAIGSALGLIEMKATEPVEPIVLIISIVMHLAIIVFGTFLFIGCAHYCETKKQVIMLPFVALMLSVGFVGRVIINWLMHTSMEPAGSSGESSYIFHSIIQDQYGTEYSLQSINIDEAYYVSSDGETVKIHRSELSSGGRFMR